MLVHDTDAINELCHSDLDPICIAFLQLERHHDIMGQGHSVKQVRRCAVQVVCSCDLPWLRERLTRKFTQTLGRLQRWKGFSFLCRASDPSGRETLSNPLDLLPWQPLPSLSVLGFGPGNAYTSPSQVCPWVSAPIGQDLNSAWIPGLLLIAVAVMSSVLGVAS